MSQDQQEDTCSYCALLRRLLTSSSACKRRIKRADDAMERRSTRQHAHPDPFLLRLFLILRRLLFWRCSRECTALFSISAGARTTRRAPHITAPLQHGSRAACCCHWHSNEIRLLRASAGVLRCGGKSRSSARFISRSPLLSWRNIRGENWMCWRERERKRKKCVNTRCKMGQTHSNPTCFSSLLVADTGDTDRVRMIVVVPFPEKEGYAESDAIATPRRLYIMGGETVTWHTLRPSDETANYTSNLTPHTQGLERTRDYSSFFFFLYPPIALKGQRF